MHAVILAGGEGVRMQPMTYVIPKPLLPVGRKPILQIIIEQLKKGGFEDISILTGYKSDLIKAYFADGKNFKVNIKYYEEKEKSGTAGPLSAIRGKINEPFILLNGDILTKADFGLIYSKHIKSRADMTVVCSKHKVNIPFGVIDYDDGVLKKITEKPRYEYTIGAGIYILNPDILESIPGGKYYDIPELINNLASLGKKIAVNVIEDEWMDLGKMEDFEKVSNLDDKWWE